MGKAKELDERIQWVLNNRPHLMVRGEPSQREWSRLARHSDGNLFGVTQVNQMRLRINAWLADPASGPEPSFELETLEALADAGKVNRTWFAQGIGTPDGPSEERAERYHVMPTVRQAALDDGFDPEFVRTFEALLDSDEQPKFTELWVLMQAAYAAYKRKTPPKGDPLEGLDDPPVRTARKKR